MAREHSARLCCCKKWYRKSIGKIMCCICLLHLHCTDLQHLIAFVIPLKITQENM